MSNWCLLLTPNGSGALAVVRLGGPGVGPFLESHFSKQVDVGRIGHGRFIVAGVELDDPVVARLSTEAADVNLHGSRLIVGSFFDAAEAAGFVRVERFPVPEGVTEAELLWHEVTAALPAVRSPAMIRRLLRQPEAWANLADGSPRQWQTVLNDPAGNWVTRLPRVAIAGRPNVGKSTLANALFGQARSITADGAGTTRDWVGGVADVDGLAVQLVDTPGVRQTNDSIEYAAIAAATEVVAAADLVVLVLNASAATDAALVSTYPDALVVANKADRAVSNSVVGIKTVATTGAGVDQLRRAIREFFGWDAAEETPLYWTRRQREWLANKLSKVR